MNLKCKKLPVILIACCSSMALNGCIGNNEKSASPASLRSLDKEQQQQVMNYLSQHNIKLSANSDGMNDNDIAANMPRIDVSDEPSSIYTYVDNRSKYNVELVGCDSASYFENHLESQIPANSYVPRTKDYAEKWKQYDGGNGIFDASHKTDNYVHFNNTPTGDNTLKCYYKVDISEAGSEHPMYFALKHHLYTYNTFWKSIGDTAQAKAAQYAYAQGYDLRKVGLEVGLPTLVAAQVPWLLYQKSYSKTTSDALDLVKRQTRELLWEKIDRLNRLWEEAQSKTGMRYSNMEKIRQELSLNEGFDLEVMYNSWEGQELSYFFLQPDAEGNIYLAVNLGHDLRNPHIITKSSDPVAFNRVFSGDQNTIDKTVIGSIDKKVAELGIDRNSPKLVTGIADVLSENELAALGIKEGSSIGKVGEKFLGREAIAVNRVTGNVMSKAGMKVVKGLSYAMDALDVVIIAAPFIVDIWAHDAPWGNYATTQVFNSFDAVSTNDASVWNSNHDAAHQIAANTKLTPPDPTDPQKQGNSPLMHMATLSYNTEVEKGVDSQLAVNISLEALTTPNKRLDYVNPQKAKDDPWLGSIDFDAKPRPQAAWDAVLHMSINSNSASPSQEIQYQGQLVQMNELGLTTLAQDERIEAPITSNLQLLNLKANRLLYSNNLNADGKSLLKVNNNGLMRVGSLEGLFLNADQQVTMSVSLPKTIANSNILYGGGFNVSYIGEDESGINNGFVPIHSDSLKAVFDGESSAPGYLYSRFTGAYPLPLGQSSQLQLRIGGYNDNKRHMGHLYLADAGSKIKTIPVYVNAHLVREPSETQIDPQGVTASSVFTIKVQNMGSEDYTKITVTGLPSDLEPIANPSGAKMCNQGVMAGAYCELTFDGKTLDGGTYQLMISGITATQLKSGKKAIDDPEDADNQPFTLDVSGGF